MIFVAVGTTEFDALVQAMDRLCPTLEEEVVIQIGRGRYVPQHAQFFRFASSLRPYYESSSLVVAHGGLGITMEVLERSKPLVSVSNPDRFDRHQDDLLEALEAEGHLLWCRELGQLPETLEQVRKTIFKPYVKPECRIAEIIRDFLNGVRSKQVTTTDTQVKSELKEMYDQLAANYDAIYRTPAGQYFMNRKIATMLKLAAFPQGSHLLEVGCANGVYTFELAKLGFQMTGLDLSPECVRIATQEAERVGLTHINFTVGDAEVLSQFEDNTFDGVISFSVLRYVPDPAQAVREIYRVLRPGGMAVVDCPNKWSPWFTFLKPLLTGQTHIHDHQYTTSQIKRMLQEAGFRKVSLCRILYTPKTIPGWTLPVMKAIDYVGERTPGFNQFASIIMAGGHK